MLYKVIDGTGEWDLMQWCVREGAFSKQQQLAMRMYKAAAQSEKYLWWVVVSIVLQVWKRPSAGQM